MSDSVLIELLKLVFAILAPVLTAALTALVVRLFKKAGMEVQQSKQDQLNSLLFKLVAQTEEWASVKIKNGVGITAQDKAEHYIALVAEKLPGVSPEEATDVAKQVLGHAKLAATAVLQDVRAAVVETK